MAHAPTSDLRATLFRARLPHDWRDRGRAASVDLGLTTSTRGYPLDIWDSKKKTRLTGSLEFVDGNRLQKMWVAPRTHGLVVRPQRFYFEGDSAQPTSRPEWDLRGSGPSLPQISQRIGQCLQIANDLATHWTDLDPEPWPPEWATKNLLGIGVRVVGGGVTASLDTNLAALLQKHGFLEAPADFRIMVCPEDSGHRGAEHYAKELRAALLRVGLSSHVELTTPADLARTLDSAAALDGTAILVGVRGRKGEPLSQDALDLVKALDRAGSPYRLFSLDNPEKRWSALDQLVSLVKAAGGVAFRLALEWPRDRAPVLLGVDLGHPRFNSTSWLSLSLVDSSGVHIGSWRAKQRKDETARLGVLQQGLLGWAVSLIREQELQGAPVIVLRDGRLLTHENPATYARALGTDLTFMELAKAPVPLIFQDPSRPSRPPMGTAYLPEGAVTPFVVASTPRAKSQIPLPFKIRIHPRWNALGLDNRIASALLAALCHSPSLGLSPSRLPAPIYWANGVASIGPTNHQFAGQQHVEPRAPAGPDRD